MSARKDEGLPTHPKVVRLAGGSSHSQSPLKGAPAGKQGEGYEPLPVMGIIKEKGFSSEEPTKVSLPNPTAIPFPVARHRSEGPYWAPLKKEDSSPAVDHKEDFGGDSLAALAQPLPRKQRAGLRLSRWKTERSPGDDEEHGGPVEAGAPSTTSTAQSLEGDLKESHSSGLDDQNAVDRGTEMIAKENQSSSQRSEIGLQETSPLANHNDPVEDVTPSSKSLDYASVAQSRSKTGATASGRESDPYHQGVREETTRSGVNPETIDAENRAAISGMSAAEVAEAQAELLERLKPDVLDMLRKRGLKKDKQWHREDKGGDEHQGTVSSGTSTQVDEAKIEDCAELTSGSPGLEPQVTKSVPSSIAIDTDKTSQGSGTQEQATKEGDSGRGDEPKRKKKEQTVVGSDMVKTWTERVEGVRLYRFDLEGNVVTFEKAGEAITPDGTSNPQILSSVERDYLRSEGDPAAAGYSLKEATALVRSTVPGHRAVALQLIAAVLDRAMLGLQTQELSYPSSSSIVKGEDVDWQAVWAYALGPEPELPLTLRLALDDTHATVVAACSKALYALLSCSANQGIFDLHEALWPGTYSAFTAPIFRKPTKQDEGFIGSGRWKYNVKPSELFPFATNVNSQGKDGEGKETVGDDATVASKDVAAGLIRMGILPRIRFILEVEQLSAADEPLLSIVKALAHHSPAGAKAVMNCPRLVDSIIQRFLLTDENLDLGVRPANTKTIQLIKTLSQASRDNCIRFAESGALQVTQYELYNQGYPLPSHPRIGQVAFKGICVTLIESLRLWRVCIHHQIGIALFSDIYPALCFWLSPLSLAEIAGNNKDDALRLAQESYCLLERLARTLPRLHPQKGRVADSSTEEFIHAHWTWNVAIPLVETALGWLSPERISAFIENTAVTTNEAANDGSQMKLAGTMASVLHFLATVCERMSVVEDVENLLEDENKNHSQKVFLPTFVPRLGLLLATNGFLSFVSTRSTTEGVHLDRKSTLFESLCSIRHKVDDETSLTATSCLHALVRLLRMVDKTIRIARVSNGPPTMSNMDKSEGHRILDRGLVVSAENELTGLLATVGNEVIANSPALQTYEANGRGGPAPGLGLGWGCMGGGSWSKGVLFSQASARLAQELLEIIPTKPERYPSEHGNESRPLEVQQEGERVDRSKKMASDLMWRISCGLGISAAAGPRDVDLVERALSEVLLQSGTLAILFKRMESTLNGGDGQDGSAGFGICSKNCIVVPEEVRKVLLEHYKSIWLWDKQQKALKSRKDLSSTGVSKGKRPGLGSSTLETVREEISGSEEGVGHANGVSGLVKEWAGQRLPLPSHWLLSPMATNISTLSCQSEGAAVGDIANVGEDRRRLEMEDVIKAGLSWLLGLETLSHAMLESFRNSVATLPLDRKVHSLSTVFVLGGDVFLHGEVRDRIRPLQEFYGCLLDASTAVNNANALELQEIKDDTDSAAAVSRLLENSMVSRACQDGGGWSLDFEGGIDGSYSTFAESLAEHFGSASFGDSAFSRQMAIYLRQGVPDAVRLPVWRVLADAQVLKLLPPLDQCYGGLWGYLYPFERNDEILEAYVSVWVSGAFDTADAQGSMSFSLALHHIAAFLFGGGDIMRDKLAIKKLARTLVRSSVRRSQQQGMLTMLLEYPFPVPTKGGAMQSAALNSEQLGKRVGLLLNACEGDSTLLAAVESLKRH